MNPLRKILRILLSALLISPLLIWLFTIDHWTFPSGEWLRPFTVSILQSLLSAAVSVAVGILMTAGALSLKSRRWRKLLEIWFLVPNLVPQLFLILAILNLSSLPVGLTAVVFAHVILNSGLVAMALLRWIGARMAGSLDLAVIEGATRRMIWLEVIVPMLRKEISFLFLFVFSVCLTSFAIPLVLGGEKIMGMEVLIYQTLRLTGDWSLTLFYVVLQMVILFVFALSVPKPNLHLSFSYSSWPQIGLARLLPLALLPSALLVVGWGMGVVKALFHFAPESLANADLVAAASGSLIVSLGVGGLILVLCLWISFVSPHRGLEIFMKGYLTPSSTITSFAVLLLPFSGGAWTLIKMILALTLISFPLLFRWMGQAALDGLQEQIVVARSLGASWLQILFEIIWPQQSPVFFRMAGIGALWACGDFAVSSIVAEGDQTWAIWIDSLMNSYRLDLASLMTVPLAAMGLLCYGLFMGASRYVRR